MFKGNHFPNTSWLLNNEIFFFLNNVAKCILPLSWHICRLECLIILIHSLMLVFPHLLITLLENLYFILFANLSSFFVPVIPARITLTEANRLTSIRNQSLKWKKYGGHNTNMILKEGLLFQ